MTILDTFYASGGDDMRLFTLELTCPAWTAHYPAVLNLN